MMNKIAILLLCASPALAATKYTKKESEITASQTALTKPTQSKKDVKSRPEISADDVFGGVGEKVKTVTDAQIKVMLRLINNTQDSDPEKPDLLFRLAELYAEQQRYYNFRGRELDQKIFDAQNANKGGEVANLKAQQQEYLKKENQWLLGAVKQYLEVADHPEKYSSYKKMDEVLFYLSYLLTQVKKDEAARKYFKRLIKDYPKSKFIADAFLSFGEFYFQQKDLENALKFYDKVLQYPESRVYGYAKYMEGWCYFNLGDFKQALTIFIDVVQMAEQGKGSANKANRIALQKEARKDIVRTYARLVGATPEKAWPLFQKFGGDYAMTMMELLGELYNSQGQFGESIKVFRNLMTLAPQSKKLCNWQTEVMKNTLSMTGSRAAPDTVKELQRLSAVYEKIKDEKGVKKDDLEECRDNTANTLRELATVWHKEAQKTNNNDTYALAQYLYKEYLTRFPKEKDAYVMTYYFAELLFKLGANGDNQKYCEAAPVYSDVVKLDPAPTAKYLKDAAYAAVISWKNCLAVEDSSADVMAARQEKLKETAKAKKGGEKEKEQAFAEQKIPDRQMKMIDAFDVYIKYVPESNELPTIKYRKARIFYEYNHYDQAIPLFRDIADNHRSSDLAIYSANLLLDCLSIRKQYKEVEQAVDAFLQAPELLKDQDFKTQLSKIKAGVLRKRIAELEGPNPKEAAYLYGKLAEDYPDDPRIDEVYFNAAVLFEKAKLIGLAIQMREQLLKVKPDSNLAKKAIYLIGRNYQDIAAFELAAQKYEDFATKFPGEKDASTALNTASFFRRGLGENEQAIKDVAEFTKLYGPRKEFVDKAAGVNFYLYQIFEQQKDKDKVRKHFTSYLKDWGTKGGVDRQVVAHVKLGEIAWKDSCPVAGVNGACVEVTRVRAAGAARVAAEKAKKAKKGKKSKGANLPPQCGPETKSKITVHDRKPGQVKEAMTHFAEALKLFKGGASEKSVPGKDETERTARINEMAYSAAQARMMEGDAEYEKFLKLAIPDKLDFSPAPPGSSPAKIKIATKKVEEAKKKFKGWVEAKTKQLQSAQKVYQGVILFKQAHWAIAASARIGQLFQDFSGQLYTAPVPKAGNPPPGLEQAEWEQLFHDAYCDQMTDTAEPLEVKAIEGLGTCLNKSTELSWFNEWSQLCESELNQIKPGEYPLASEIRAEPGYAAVRTDRTDVQALENK